jgi:hypothetical protein
MHTMKSDNQYVPDLKGLAATERKEPAVMSTIIFNPIQNVDTEEYSDASIEQRAIYIKNKCNEARITILTLSKMFEGEISELEIPALNLSVPCILKIHKKLTPKECSHIMSVSPHLEII